MNVSSASSPAASNSEPERTANQPEGEKVCWIEVKQSAFQANHQVELLHLLAEADALLLQLQTLSSK
ncbi:MAG: hypothetical protein F6K04_12050 [Leptolyngbya sp. SIO4C5]|nr:hypothetical protein [Leptolyngbya sp. SIO4C5]